MSLKNNPSRAEGSGSLSGIVARLTGALNRHVTTWAGRYVEMRLDARRTGRD